MATLSKEQLNELVHGYLACVEWTGTTSEEEQQQGRPECVDQLHYTWTRNAKQKAKELVKGFLHHVTQKDFEDYLEKFDCSSMGHDLLLSANGHGAGFWDRGLGKLGDRLHKLAKGHGSDVWCNHRQKKLNLE